MGLMESKDDSLSSEPSSEPPSEPTIEPTIEPTSEPSGPQSITDWGFSSWDLQTQTRGHVLQYVTGKILRMHGDLIGHGVVDEMHAFFSRVEHRGYNASIARVGKQVPHYHNAVHGADVCQAYNWLLTSGNSNLLGILRHSESNCRTIVMAGIVASALHDYDHPGLTSQFLVHTRDPLALRYDNDPALLERHHAASALAVLDEWGYLVSWFGDDFAEKNFFKKHVTELILATSADHHNRLVTTPPADLSTDYLHTLQLAMHCADLSNAARPIDICLKWTAVLLEEFRLQGDQEMVGRLAFTNPYMDRSTPEHAIFSMQIDFYKRICFPAFSHLQIVCPEIRVWLDQLAKNQHHYENQLLPSQ